MKDEARVENSAGKERKCPWDLDRGWTSGLTGKQFNLTKISPTRTQGIAKIVDSGEREVYSFSKPVLIPEGGLCNEAQLRRDNVVDEGVFFRL